MRFDTLRVIVVIVVVVIVVFDFVDVFSPSLESVQKYTTVNNTFLRNKNDFVILQH